MSFTASYWIHHLDLFSHPEGGYYKEVYRSAEHCPTPRGLRACMTSIYFLLEYGNFSAFHRIASDEIWLYHAGDGAIIHVISPEGQYDAYAIGPSSVLQVVIPAGHWFAAEVTKPDGYILVGCTVAPGFDFADFELARRDALIKDFPMYEALITRLTRPQA